MMCLSLILQGTVDDLKSRDRNLKVTVDNLKTQLADMSREIAAVQGTPQSSDGDESGTIRQLKGTVDNLKTQLAELSREVAVLKARPQPNGTVAESTPLVAGAMMNDHKYTFMGEDSSICMYRSAIPTCARTRTNMHT